MSQINNPSGITEARVGVICPAPTGVAATDTANAEAALKKAGELGAEKGAPGGLAIFSAVGVYKINKELLVPANGSVRIDPNVSLEAASPFTGEAVLSSSKTEQSLRQQVYGGGLVDAANIATYAFYPRYFGDLTIDIKCRNGKQDDVVLGDPTATAASFGPIFGPQFTVHRTATGMPTGYSCVWARNCSDGRIPNGTSVYGQETGWRIESGDWQGFGVHPIGGTSRPMAVGIEDNGGNQWFGGNYDTMIPSEHGTATGSAVNNTITDTAILANHECRPVTGTNIPAGAYVGAVTPGASFLLVNSAGEELKPTGAVAGITLLGVGILAKQSHCSVTGGMVYNNSGSGVDKGCIGVVFKAGTVKHSVSGGFMGQGADETHRVLKVLGGDLRQAQYTRLVEVHVSEETPPVAIPGGYVAKAENYAMVVSIATVGVTSTAAERTITLPALSAVIAPSSAHKPFVYSVIDESNGAATKNIIVKCAGSDKFTDGTAEKKITVNGGQLAFYSNGTAWVPVAAI